MDAQTKMKSRSTKSLPHQKEASTLVAMAAAGRRTEASEISPKSWYFDEQRENSAEGGNWSAPRAGENLMKN
jgi:hypothetical protein